MRQLHDPENSRFVAWWNTIIARLETSSEVFSQRAIQIEFLPAVTLNKGDDEFTRAYQRGLDEAEALFITIIDQLKRQLEPKQQETGYESAEKSQPASEPVEDEHAPLTRLQAQRLMAAIDLQRYDPQAQTQLRAVLHELEQGVMGGSTVNQRLAWLAAHAPDILVAIIARAAHVSTGSGSDINEEEMLRQKPLLF